MFVMHEGHLEFRRPEWRARGEGGRSLSGTLSGISPGWSSQPPACLSEQRWLPAGPGLLPNLTGGVAPGLSAGDRLRGGDRAVREGGSVGVYSYFNS